jgi:hypothetical protein
MQPLGGDNSLIRTIKWPKTSHEPLDRVNDIHLTNAQKQAARDRKNG